MLSIARSTSYATQNFATSYDAINFYDRMLGQIRSQWMTATKNKTYARKSYPGYSLSKQPLKDQLMQLNFISVG